MLYKGNLPKKVPGVVVVYTDGSCYQGKGSWAAILTHGREELQITGKAYRTTNNRMELRAVVEAMKYFHPDQDILIVSDSQYVVNAINKGWLFKWIRNGWRNSSGEKVKNKDLWKMVIKLISIHHVRFRWVRGHNGHEMNEEAHKLASRTRS